MLKLLRSLLPFPETAEAAGTPHSSARTPPPAVLSAPGIGDFDLRAHLSDAGGFPLPDWDRVQDWVERVAEEAEQAKAWSAAEHAWLQHLCAALGERYCLREEGSTLLVSSLDDRVAQATLRFVNRTSQRIVRLLDGIAQVSPWGYDILLVLDDEDTYYRYVAQYYPEPGEFAASSGMYINHGCGHFVTVTADLRAIEPVIAHELTHACVSHLPLPAWLNEGIAVNTEQRLSPAPGRPDPQAMHARHRSFWGPEEIQQFWSGKSFLRPDEGNALSYDLARILVAQFGADWPRFQAFVVEADAEDAGASAAQARLGVGLGDAVAALLEFEPGPQWAPDPQRWPDRPERGAFNSRPLQPGLSSSRQR